MKNNVYSLKDLYNVQGGTLTSYAIDMPFDSERNDWRRPAVVIAPGGGYAYCSKREGEVVALDFASKGYNAFVLDYMCVGDGVHYPEQLLELAVSVDFVRNNAEKFSVNPDEIFIVGFSAGGHLAASLSTDYAIASELYGGGIDPRVQGAGLIYPVISDEYGHCATYENLFKHADDETEKKYIELTKMDGKVCERTAPAFLFSTFEDGCVPSLNSVKYAEALAKNSIPYEIHVYRNGGHGMSLANAEINNDASKITRNRNWINDCAAFFRDFAVEPF